ncbi:MAG: mechanosensitive ion channel domain-containing protein [Pseudomonadota bacterium]
MLFSVTRRVRGAESVCGIMSPVMSYPFGFTSPPPRAIRGALSAFAQMALLWVLLMAGSVAMAQADAAAGDAEAQPATPAQPQVPAEVAPAPATDTDAPATADEQADVEPATADGEASDAAATPEADAAPERLTLAKATQKAKSYGMRVFWAVIVMVFAYQLIKGVIYILDRLAERHANRRLAYKRLVPIVRLVLWTFTLFLVVRVVLQIDNQGLVAAAAAIGVAVGLAAQGILKNIFGGLVIVADSPFQVGDKIEVAGTYGEVISIGLRSTRIQTPDDNMVSVPNAQIIDSQVSNANAGELNCQVVTDLYLPGSADEKIAKRIAYQAAASSRYTFLGKPIVVIVKDEYDYAHILHLKIKAYVLDTRYEFLLMSDITERARAEFRRVGLLTSSPTDPALRVVGAGND